MPPRKQMSPDATRLYEWFQIALEADLGDARQALNMTKDQCESALNQLKSRGLIERQPRYRLNPCRSNP